MENVAKFRDYLEENRDRHVGRIRDFVSYPTVSTENEQSIEACAKWLVDCYKQLGCKEAELVETKGLPGVWAYLNAGAQKTICNYGNFDVAPVVDESKWDSPPFAGKLTKKVPFGQVMVGRGAMSHKGPYMAWLNALEALIAVEGKLPVNVMFLVEGEEVPGSLHYREMFDRYKNKLKNADACFSPGVSQDSNGNVQLTLGFKTFIQLEMEASGSAWGRGPKGSLVHGMAKSVVDSPVWRLVHAMSSLTAKDGNKVRIKDFYSDFPPPSDVERGHVAELRKQLGDKRWQQVLRGVGDDVKQPIDDCSEEEVFLRYFYGASFNINGLKSGYIGPGTETFTIPHEASCLFDIRLPRGSRADKTIERLRKHLDSHGYQDIQLKVIGAYDSCQADPNSELVKAIQGVFKTQGVSVIVWPCSGGGGPWALYQSELGMPVIQGVGLGFGGNVGGPNEYLVIEGDGKVGGLIDTELSHIQMLTAYASPK